MDQDVRTVLEPHPLVEMMQEDVRVARSRLWWSPSLHGDECDGDDVLDYLPYDYGCF